MARVEQLVPEVWIYIFGFLSTADKLILRICSKYFKELIDKSSLWKNYVVVLKDVHAYNSKFWTTLRHWNINSVVVRRAKRKNLKQLAKSLPSLTTISIDKGSEEECLGYLKKFPNLSNLMLKDMKCCLEFSRSLVPLHQQVTVLSVCCVHLRSIADFINTVSQFTRLTSLLFHPPYYYKRQHIPVKTFHSMLNCLPKLKHLSWEMPESIIPDNYFSPTNVHRGPTVDSQPGGLALTSLELVNFTNIMVPENAISSLASLQTLAIYHSHLDGLFDTRCHLRTWFGALHQLTALIIDVGFPLSGYGDSIPVTVTSLSLRMPIEVQDMVAVGQRVPGLLHLHFDPWESKRHLSLFPQLFPQLRTLKIRHRNISDNDFLNLHQLQQLERLEILDAYSRPSPHLLDLINQLHALSNYRVHVVTSTERDPLTCFCTRED